jgi:hypothetical protein
MVGQKHRQDAGATAQDAEGGAAVNATMFGAWSVITVLVARTIL